MGATQSKSTNDKELKAANILDILLILKIKIKSLYVEL